MVEAVGQLDHTPIEVAVTNSAAANTAGHAIDVVVDGGAFIVSLVAVGIIDSLGSNYDGSVAHVGQAVDGAPQGSPGTCGAADLSGRMVYPSWCHGGRLPDWLP
jgi:hypothetical protein